jgi:hypothetical protein
VEQGQVIGEANDVGVLHSVEIGEAVVEGREEGVGKERQKPEDPWANEQQPDPHPTPSN